MPIRRSPSSDSPREIVLLLLPGERLLLRPIVLWTPAAPGIGDPIGSRVDAIEHSELRRVGGLTGADIDGGAGGVGSRVDAIEHIEFRRVGGRTGALSGPDVDGGAAGNMAVHGQRRSGAHSGTGTGSL